MKGKLVILFSTGIAIALASGCSTTPKTSPAAESAISPKAGATALEGSWSGLEVTTGHEGPCTLKISGHNLEFHGTDTNDWANGTFTLLENHEPKQILGTVTDCPAPDFIGKKTHSIYNIEDGTLTLAGYQENVGNFPPAFNVAGLRRFVLKRDR